MTALETLVRPFQTPDFVPGRLTTGRPQTPPDAVIMMCGNPEGQISSLQGSRSASVTSYTEGQQQEVSRNVVPVRVKNPDDPDQHVDVDVTTGITIANKDGDKVTKSEVKYAPVVSTALNEMLGGERALAAPLATEGWPTSWKK